MTEVNRMDVAMEVEDQNANGSNSPPPGDLPPENHDDSPTRHSPCLGTVVPNRIFVGGIDYKVNEGDLRRFFSQHGVVKEVKIVIDRSGMSKGYGFVTFENKDDVLKILHNENGIYFKDKKLCIGQAFRRRTSVKSLPVSSPTCLLMPCGTLSQTMSTGYPYAYHNGMAYFHCPNMTPPPYHWPQPAPPVMMPQSHQPVYQQPVYHHYQCVPNQYQWNVVQPPMPSGPVMYSQPSEYVYQPTDGASVQPALPVMEDTTPEFIEPRVRQMYPLYPQRTEGMTTVVLQHDPGKNQRFPRSHVHLKYWRHRKDIYYFPEAAEPPDASAPH